ncbi:very long chain fatty acid elongase 7-like [Ornithodoros turicata]|uniref:very long chain fatty acid elongase 7-like n=1 Tax=Ornithodoros turicata TaxID=34597 RepID=UPI00313A2009
MESAVLTKVSAERPLFLRDPRIQGWWLSGNVPFLCTLLLSYVYFVKSAGPRYMKNRKPLDSIKPFILVYNLAMVLSNVYFLINFLKRTYVGGGYSWFCQGIDYSAKDDTTVEVLNLCWWYLWVRVADFLDTVFFVLRKKDSHVSFLHVAHHCIVVFDGWFGLACGPDGQVILSLCINSFIHVVMYSYYFLSLLGPAVQKHLWWKKYLTQMQITQFFVVMVHTAIPLFKDCGYPRVHVYLLVSQGAFFIVMFMNFYLKSYKKRDERLKKAQ